MIYVLCVPSFEGAFLSPLYLFKILRPNSPPMIIGPRRHTLDKALLSNASGPASIIDYLHCSKRTQQSRRLQSPFGVIMTVTIKLEEEYHLICAVLNDAGLD